MSNVEKQTSIHLPGVSHGKQPFPLASRVGPIVATSGIFGIDPDTGELAEDPEDQVALAFSNLGRVLEIAGGEMSCVVRVVVHVLSMDLRPTVNRVWETWFPDPAHRPARNTLIRELGGGAVCALHAEAYID
jgi:enamine deaminase RidA (YjgF/YER057c/UK114 family)